MFMRQEAQCIVACTRCPDGCGLPQTSAIVHAKLGLSDSCAAFDISLGSAGFEYGLSVIQGYMQGNGFRKGDLFTADPCSMNVDQQNKNINLLFGDDAMATLYSDMPAWRNGYLTMNGHAVCSFSATVVQKNYCNALCQ